VNIGMMCHSSLGGSARVATELAMMLVQRGHKVWIFSKTPPVTQLMRHPNLRLCSLLPIPDDTYDHAVLRTEWSADEQEVFVQKLCAAIRKERIELLHFHYALPFADIAKRVRERLGFVGPKIVGTLHGTDVTKLAKVPSLAKQVGEALGTADVVTTVSHAHARLSQMYLPTLTPPIVIPNFIDVQRFFPSLRRAQNQPLVVLHASNFRAIKQPLVVAKIFLGLQEKLKADVQLQLMGTGPELHSTIDFLKRAGVGDKVKALGFRTDVTGAFQEADLVVIASQYESFSLVALEAMACGTPVLAPAVGGIPEVVKNGDTGALYRPNDIDEAVHQGVGLLSCQRGRERLRWLSALHARDFDAERVIPQYIDIYRHLLAIREPLLASSPIVVESV
tara:strand:+ start:20876 stop:22051 length:1176 start_codon:yes stop_codon:yes gene_type:complete